MELGGFSCFQLLQRQSHSHLWAVEFGQVYIEARLGPVLGDELV
jgi:hypothetical protein